MPLIPPLTSAEEALIEAAWFGRTTRGAGRWQTTVDANSEVTKLARLRWTATETGINYPWLWLKVTITGHLEGDYEDDFNSYHNKVMSGTRPYMTAGAVQKIRDWREKQEEEPPEDEEPPEEEDPVDGGGGLLDGAWDTIRAWIKEAILAGLAFLDGPLQIINNMVSALGQTISGMVEAVKSAISTVMAEVVGMFDIVVAKIKGVIDKVWENIELVWMTLKDMFDTVKSAILIAFEKSWIFIKETFTTLWTKIKEGLTYIGNAIVEGLKYLWDKIKDALGWVWDILNNAFKAIVDTVTAIWDRFKERLTETIESIKEGFGDAIEWLVEMFEAWRKSDVEALKIDQDWPEERFTEFIIKVMGVQKKVLEKIAEAKGKI